MRKNPYSAGTAALVLTSCLLFSCQTAKERLDPPDYQPLLPESTEPAAEAELPLPEMPLSLFLPLPPTAEEEETPTDLPLPDFREEEPAAAVVPAPEPEPVTLPDETPRPAIPQAFAEETPPPATNESDTPTVEKTEEESPPREPEAVKVPLEKKSVDEQDKSPVAKEETVPSGDVALLDLEGSDWFFLEEKEGNSADFVDRTTMDGKTLFSFQFPGPGTYRLVFQRQDHSTGETERTEILVTVAEPENEAQASEVIASDSADEGTTGPEEQNASEVTKVQNPSVAEASERLDMIEDDPDKVQETLELLEFLVDAASDDESLAEYYYRMARTLEKNTRFQDLRRAYETYEYIERTFFLTDYYEKAVERIRYLDRHFFKLR